VERPFPDSGNLKGVQMTVFARKVVDRSDIQRVSRIGVKPAVLTSRKYVLVSDKDPSTDPTGWRTVTSLKMKRLPYVMTHAAGITRIAVRRQAFDPQHTLSGARKA